MTGCAPDYCLLMVGANAGLIGMSKEHLVRSRSVAPTASQFDPLTSIHALSLAVQAVALALNVPVIVCITKIDMTPAHVLDQTKAQLGKILRSPGCRSVHSLARLLTPCAG
jgi:GTPase